MTLKVVSGYLYLFQGWWWKTKGPQEGSDRLPSPRKPPGKSRVSPDPYSFTGQRDVSCVCHLVLGVSERGH